MSAELTLHEFNIFVELEREIDSEKLGYVTDKNGYRIAISPEIKTQFRLVTGQTISDFMVSEILRAKKIELREKIAAKQAASNE